jgi:hypothetical protein
VQVLIQNSFNILINLRFPIFSNDFPTQTHSRISDNSLSLILLTVFNRHLLPHTYSFQHVSLDQISSRTKYFADILNVFRLVREFPYYSLHSSHTFDHNLNFTTITYAPSPLQQISFHIPETFVNVPAFQLFFTRVR